MSFGPVLVQFEFIFNLTLASPLFLGFLFNTLSVGLWLSMLIQLKTVGTQMTTHWLDIQTYTPISFPNLF